jgi:hypothetical protein
MLQKAIFQTRPSATGGGRLFSSSVDRGGWALGFCVTRLLCWTTGVFLAFPDGGASGFCKMVNEHSDRNTCHESADGTDFLSVSHGGGPVGILVRRYMEAGRAVNGKGGFCCRSGSLVMVLGKWTAWSGGLTSMRPGFGRRGTVRRMGRPEPMPMPMLRLSATDIGP